LLARRDARNARYQSHFACNSTGTDSPIQHQKIAIAPQQDAEPAAVHRYRTSRPWSVGVLAAAAAGAAILLTSGLSAAFKAATVSDSEPTRQRAANAAAGIASPVIPAWRSGGPAVASTVGGWQIQVGAFRSPGAAQAQLRAVETLVPELASFAQALPSRGEVTHARFGRIADEPTARRLCGRVLDAGGHCFVVRPGG